MSSVSEFAQRLQDWVLPVVALIGLLIAAGAAIALVARRPRKGAAPPPSMVPPPVPLPGAAHVVPPTTAPVPTPAPVPLPMPAPAPAAVPVESRPIENAVSQPGQPATPAAGPVMVGATGTITLLVKEPSGNRSVEVRLPARLGRSEDSDLQLDDEEVSRAHCFLTAEAGILTVIDLGSSNGTRVNDARVERAVLRHGDQVEIGRTRITVQ